MLLSAAPPLALAQGLLQAPWGRPWMGSPCRRGNRCGPEGLPRHVLSPAPALGSREPPTPASPWVSAGRGPGRAREDLRGLHADTNRAAPGQDPRRPSGRCCWLGEHFFRGLGMPIMAACPAEPWDSAGASPTLLLELWTYWESALEV